MNSCIMNARYTIINVKKLGKDIIVTTIVKMVGLVSDGRVR
jgi:hypothetical protein